MSFCFSIINRDKERAPDYADILQEIAITESTTEQADTITIRISDVGNEIELPKEGEVVQAALGESGRMLKMGTFIVDKVSMGGPPDSITLTGSACPFTRAEDLKSLSGRKTRSWPQGVTLGVLAAGIAAEAGMKASVSQKLASIFFAHLDQTAESNISFLTRIARDCGAVVKPTFGQLVLVEHGDGKNTKGESLPTFTITREPGMKWSADFSKRAQAGAVQVQKGWVSNTIYAGQEGGGGEELPAQGDGDDGDNRDDSEGEGETTQERYPQPTEEMAKRKARARKMCLKRAEANLSFDLHGLWAVCAGQRIAPAGFRPEITTRPWVASRVSFRLTKGGLRTTIECQPPGTDEPPKKTIKHQSQTIYENGERPSAESG